MSVALDAPADGSMEQHKQSFDADFDVGEREESGEFRADSHWPVCDFESCGP